MNHLPKVLLLALFLATACGEDSSAPTQSAQEPADVGVDTTNSNVNTQDTAFDIEPFDTTMTLDAVEDTVSEDTVSSSDVSEFTPDPPNFDIFPCGSPEYWPGQLHSQRRPFVVHYQRARDEEEARRVLELLEHAWDVEVDQLGFRPPLPDEGQCGPDSGFDVFLWRGYDEAAVDILEANPETPWDDYTSYMIVDPWGTFGNTLLSVTIAHEFNHACQASDDWWDALVVYEMTATFVEEIVFGEVDDYHTILTDFQSRPHRSIDWSDNYRTWYMYASALYLHFLKDRYFDGDARFVSEMWLRMRNVSSAVDDSVLNEPDFEDALDAMLREYHEVGFLDSLVTFARWRWYTGSRDDGQHFEEGAAYPPNASVELVGTVPAQPGTIELEPELMMLGSAYLELVAMDGNPGSVVVELDIPVQDGARWVMQAVPGLDGASDGELFDLAQGPAQVMFAPQGTRTLIFTVLPTGEYDPETRDVGQRYGASAVLSLP